ncbi:hypothetical protein MN116_000689 [Schistosoma mekongi]|uniref:XPG N-terminal domain-containing protein n=1 Tax=Schistosoma mekongi TaxID=38744 RepID=A0AAE2D9M2_SCHME|nr:hypothetical protein MN116_000689 [Schistosoma mekongi]
MGVRGLTTYLQSDSQNFIKYELHNTTVIIDALNFLNFIYFESGIHTQFNGEYLAFSGVINRYINSLRRCHINPIFVFDGCHEYFKLATQVKRNHQRMQACREFLKHIKSHNLSPTDSSNHITLLPPLATVTLVQALGELKVDYVTTDSESDQDIVSLGIYLQCPVISNDSDFYVTIPSTTAGVCFLPLSFISFEPIINSTKCNICRTHNKICAYLKCQQFLPNGPGLKCLPDVQRPLFASLLGIENNVTFRFPNHLIGIEKSKSSSLYYITEFDRKGSFHIKRRKVFVHPMNLLENNEITGKDHRLVFLQQYLGLEYDNLEFDNNWLTSIVLINVLTFKSKCIPYANDDITQCPISLSFGAICICTYLLIRHYNYSDLSYCKPLKKHFYNCAKYFITQLHSTIQKNYLAKQNNIMQSQHTLKIHIVHIYAQLQIYYITISTLINLLNCLVTNNDRNNLSTCLNLLPIYTVFPSGYLFHEICYCTHLIQSDNNERQQYVRNVIIEKLMNYQNTNKKHLNDALNLFNCYLTLSSMQLYKSSFIKCSTNVKLVESNFADNVNQSHDNNNNNDMSSMENEIKQANNLNMLQTKKIENITQTKKKVKKRKCKQAKQHIKQPSYAETEEKITKLMLENDLFD